ncbi:MAG: HlyD family efflux transporter periplasmic adaptor subunit [Bacteroidota bacterium]|nr:HlyD family efflux transporter periplasmic adaptor subunit [Bacteroidota bacterium]
MNKRRVTVIISIALIIAVSVVLMRFFTDMKKAPKQASIKNTELNVHVKKVKYSDIATFVSASGRVISTQQVGLISEVQGKMLAGDVLLKKGMSFKKGDVLVHIFKKNVEYSLKSRKSSFLNLLAGMLPDLKVDFPKEYKIWNTYFNNLDINENFDEIPSINSSKLKVFLSSRNILSNYYAIKSEEEQLKKYVITAPFDGTFTDVTLQIGSVANPGSRLANMIRTDDLEVEIPVESAEAKFLSIGNKVTLYSDNQKYKYNGIICRKSNFVDQSTQSLSIFVSVINNNATIFQGEYLKGEFQGNVLQNVMGLPRNAVTDNNKIYTVINNKLKKHTIIIEKYNEKTVLFSGIKQGLLIVTEPLVNAKEGEKVNIL